MDEQYLTEIIVMSNKEGKRSIFTSSFFYAIENFFTKIKVRKTLMLIGFSNF